MPLEVAFFRTDYSIVGGVPAKVIRSRFEPAIVDRLMALEWWNALLDRGVVGQLDFADIETTLERLETLKSEGKLAPATFKTKPRGGRWYQRLFG